MSSSVILFARNEFAMYDSNDDRLFEINPRIVFSGSLFDKMAATGAGVVFKRFTGEPLPRHFSGTIFMTMGGESRMVWMNGKGVVER